VVAHNPAEPRSPSVPARAWRTWRRRWPKPARSAPLDRATRATIGGTLSTGLSGLRRLRYGPLRDKVLEVRFATADGRLVRGGGPTVKNVTGYDVPRLLVGSLGTIGVLTRVILRCQPRPTRVQWAAGDRDPEAVRAACFRPSAVLWDGSRTTALVEGDARDVEAELASAGLIATDAPDPWPVGEHRGRVSIAPLVLRYKVLTFNGSGEGGWVWIWRAIAPTDL
jgi:glycolate oxidase FAD binding subunit